MATLLFLFLSYVRPKSSFDDDLPNSNIGSWSWKERTKLKKYCSWSSLVSSLSSFCFKWKPLDEWLQKSQRLLKDLINWLFSVLPWLLSINLVNII